MKISALVFLVSMFMAFAGRTMAILTNISDLAVIYYVFIFISLCMLYVLGLMRLYYTFRGSTYAIKNSYVYVHIVNITIVLSLFICAVIFSNLISLRSAFIIQSIANFIFIVGYINIAYKFCHNMEINAKVVPLTIGWYLN